jgi:hypothetical protein
MGGMCSSPQSQAAVTAPHNKAEAVPELKGLEVGPIASGAQDDDGTTRRSR